MNKGLLIVVSGFSGAGKGTLMKKFVGKYPDYALSVSATTRPPRSGEIEGVDYFFKTEEEFKKMIEGGELLEYEGYVGHYYGTPKKYIDDMTAGGRDVLLEIDVRGGLNVKKKMPEAVLVFVSAPSIKEIERRLKARGADSDEEIAERMNQIKRETRSIPDYDYLLINDDLEECTSRLYMIAEAERQRVAKNKPYIDKLKKEIYGGTV